jgi:hypothetical protein
MLDKSWYYAYDEPQNPTEYNLAALNCWMMKKAIPGLRVGVCMLETALYRFILCRLLFVIELVYCTCF